MAALRCPKAGHAEAHSGMKKLLPNLISSYFLKVVGCLLRVNIMMHTADHGAINDRECTMNQYGWQIEFLNASAQQEVFSTFQKLFK